MFEAQIPQLAALLIQAGRLDAAVDLLADPRWLALRLEAFGYEAFADDGGRILLAAAQAGRDEQVLRTLLRVDEAARRYRRSWDDGQAAAAIARAPTAAAARSVLRSLGGSGAPGAGLLAVARLLDLGLAADARELLESQALAHWPRHASLVRSHGLASWGDIGMQPLAAALARAVEASPGLAARIARRLFRDQPRTTLPNAASLWTQLLQQLLASGAPAVRLVGAVEQSIDMLELGDGVEVVPAVVQNLAQARYEALEAVAPAADAGWLKEQVFASLELYRISSSFVGEDRQLALFRSSAPLLLHLAKLGSLVHDGRLLQALEACIRKVRRILPLPDMPGQHAYGDRSAVLARYALALQATGRRDHGRAVAAALAACRLDALCSDPPLHAVRQALSMLEGSPVAAVRKQASAVRRQLAERLGSGDAAAMAWTPDAASQDALEYGLAVLALPADAPVPPFQPGPRKPDGPPADPVPAQILQSLLFAWSQVPNAGAPARALRLHHDLPALAGDEPYLPLFRCSVAAHMSDAEGAQALLREALDESLAEDDDETAFFCWCELAKISLRPAVELSSRFDHLSAQGRATVALTLLDIAAGSPQADDALIEDLIARLPPHLHPMPSRPEQRLLRHASRFEALRRWQHELAARSLAALEQELPRALELGDWAERTRAEDEAATRPAAEAMASLACATIDFDEDRLRRALHPWLERWAEDEPVRGTRKVWLAHLVKLGQPLRRESGRDFYLHVLGGPAAGDLFPESLDWPTEALELACCMQASWPAEAQTLADAAFDCASQRVLRQPPPQDPTHRLLDSATRLLASALGGPGLEDREALDFAQVVARWGTGPRREASRHALESIATRAWHEGIRQRLRGASALLAMGGEQPGQAEPWLSQAPEAVIDELGFPGQLPTRATQRAWAREQVAKRLQRRLAGGQALGPWLERLLVLGLADLSAAEAFDRLDAIERSCREALGARAA